MATIGNVTPADPQSHSNHTLNTIVHTHTRTSRHFPQIRVNKTKALRVSGSVLLQGTDGHERSKVPCVYSRLQ